MKIQTEEEVFRVLKLILERYDEARTGLKLPKEQAIERVLESYDEFYYWLTLQGDFKDLTKEMSKKKNSLKK